MSETATKWDAADHLHTGRRASLPGSLRRGGPGRWQPDARRAHDIARARNMSQLAREAGMSREGL